MSDKTDMTLFPVWSLEHFFHSKHSTRSVVRGGLSTCSDIRYVSVSNFAFFLEKYGDYTLEKEINQS